MDLINKRVLVAGTGISGIGAAKLLNAVGAAVVLYDSNEGIDRIALDNKLSSAAINPDNVDIVIGKLPDRVIEKLDLAVISPGVPIDTDFVAQIRRHGVTVWGEVELAYHFSKGKIAAITGTNGKTTTTALVGEIFKAYFKSVFVVGNIGRSFTEKALETEEDSVIAAEISSFQLESIEHFHPFVSAVLNITPDHLNRHYTMENYVAVKEQIGKNQTAADYMVLNYDDSYTRAIGSRAKAEVIYFSSTQALENGYYYKDGELIYAEGGKKRHLCDEHELKILGLHNMENIMAAIAITRCFEVPFEVIYKVITAFMGVEHRIEYVATVHGVDYYNDSKGTNTDAAIKAIQAMVKPTVLIGGGYDKKAQYDEWVEAFKDKAKYLVLLGKTADDIEKCARAHGYERIIRAKDLEGAVSICAEYAEPGDAVLLSPACASWDMFKSYEQRGELFKKCVHELEDPR